MTSKRALLFVTFAAATATAVCSCSPHAYAGVLPDLDPMVERMGARFAPIPIDPTAPGAQTPYFDVPIPHIVHQIWFGDPGRMCGRTAQWQAFAQRFGYGYKLWSENDDEQLRQWMPQENFDTMVRLRGCHDLQAASDVLRISLLRHLGGVYCDVDMTPPTQEGRMLDLTAVLPMRGIVLLTENFARNVGNSAMFFANGLMMSSPNHPVLAHLEDTLPKNVQTLYPDFAKTEATQCFDDALHTTGCAFLSRSLAGALTVLPITYARKLNMVHDGKWDAESGVPYTTDEIGGLEAWTCKP